MRSPETALEVFRLERTLGFDLTSYCFQLERRVERAVEETATIPPDPDNPYHYLLVQWLKNPLGPFMEFPVGPSGQVIRMAEFWTDHLALTPYPEKIYPRKPLYHITSGLALRSLGNEQPLLPPILHLQERIFTHKGLGLYLALLLLYFFKAPLAGTEGVLWLSPTVDREQISNEFKAGILNLELERVKWPPREVIPQPEFLLDFCFFPLRSHYKRLDTPRQIKKIGEMLASWERETTALIEVWNVERINYVDRREWAPLTIGLLPLLPEWLEFLEGYAGIRGNWLLTAQEFTARLKQKKLRVSLLLDAYQTARALYQLIKDAWENEESPWWFLAHPSPEEKRWAFPVVLQVDSEKLYQLGRPGPVVLSSRNPKAFVPAFAIDHRVINGVSFPLGLENLPPDLRSAVEEILKKHHWPTISFEKLPFLEKPSPTARFKDSCMTRYHLPDQSNSMPTALSPSELRELSVKAYFKPFFQEGLIAPFLNWGLPEVLGSCRALLAPFDEIISKLVAGFLEEYPQYSRLPRKKIFEKLRETLRYLHPGFPELHPGVLEKWREQYGDPEIYRQLRHDPFGGLVVRPRKKKCA